MRRVFILSFFTALLFVGCRQSDDNFQWKQRLAEKYDGVDFGWRIYYNFNDDGTINFIEWVVDQYHNFDSYYYQDGLCYKRQRFDKTHYYIRDEKGRVIVDSSYYNDWFIYIDSIEYKNLAQPDKPTRITSWKIDLNTNEINLTNDTEIIWSIDGNYQIVGAAHEFLYDEYPIQRLPSTQL